MAILSYEGSAGRTLIARNLFRNAVVHGDSPVQLACFDVEKPDLIDYAGIEHSVTENIFAPQPFIDISKCRYCGVCSGYCPEKAIQFNRYVPSVTLIVSLCIACGHCRKGCDRKGIRMQEKLSGKITLGHINNHLFIAGELNENSEFQLPLINALHDRLSTEATVICDFGPGTGGTINAGLTKMDFAVIVLQPDAHWQEHLEALLELTKKRKIPAGVILNKVKDYTLFENEVQTFCDKYIIPLLGIIPFDTDMADESLLGNKNSYGSFGRSFSETWNRMVDIFPETILLQNETFK